MELQMAATSLHWSLPAISPSSRRRSFFDGDLALFRQYAETSRVSSKLNRSRSCDKPKPRVLTIRRALSASFSPFPDEDDDSAFGSDHRKPFDGLKTPEFSARDEIIPANSVGFPLPLRKIRRKKQQWQGGFIQAGESAYCSVNKAFSSTVLIIHELHSFTMQMREILFCENLQGILETVHQEVHASFVWLFQKVFSHTPTLMVYVMILLANYSVYSMSTNVAIAGVPPVQAYTSEQASIIEHHKMTNQNMDLSFIKMSTLPSSNTGKEISVGGIGGDGGKYRPVTSGTDGDDRFRESGGHFSMLESKWTTEDELVSYTEQEEELWKSIENEAFSLQAQSRDEALDHATMLHFVSPIHARVESEDDDCSEYSKTEMQYLVELAQDPGNPLLLANFAQFLYLIAQDFDRAEDYFQRATKVEPKDAEALNKFANFLWMGKKDLWAAEQTFLEAIDAEPNSPFYQADYARFLWNTGGEDTCFEPS